MECELLVLSMTMLTSECAATSLKSAVYIHTDHAAVAMKLLYSYLDYLNIYSLDLKEHAR